MVIGKALQEVELLESVKLYFRDVLEIAGQLVVTLWGETKCLLLQSSGTDLFKLVASYLGDGPEMERHAAITLDMTLHSHH